MNRIAILDRAMLAQLDRLASGDLPEIERTTLLAWLDEDVARWRACGLAFLDAQMWQEAAAIVPSATGPTAIVQQPVAETTGPKDNFAGRRVSSLALTAAVALAFLFGVCLARWLPTEASRSQQIVEQPSAEQPIQLPVTTAAKPVIATVPVKTNLDTQGPLLLQLHISSEPSQDLAVNSSISHYERQQWERRGFEVLEELRYLPARLPDGRQIMVPVNKVQLKFKGTPVS